MKKNIYIGVNLNVSVCVAFTKSSYTYIYAFAHFYGLRIMRITLNVGRVDVSTF